MPLLQRVDPFRRRRWKREASRRERVSPPSSGEGWGAWRRRWRRGSLSSRRRHLRTVWTRRLGGSRSRGCREGWETRRLGFWKRGGETRSSPCMSGTRRRSSRCCIPMATPRILASSPSSSPSSARTFASILWGEVLHFHSLFVVVFFSLIFLLMFVWLFVGGNELFGLLTWLKFRFL